MRVRVKAYVVRAEDARLLGDMPSMRKMYAELHSLNRKLVGEYAKRANNHRVGGIQLVPIVEELAMQGETGTSTRGALYGYP